MNELQLTNVQSAGDNSLLPIDGLKDSVQQFILDVTESYGCPRDYVATASLITAGIAAGKAKLVTGPYINYPTDFVAIVGKPGSNKSAPLSEVTRPLSEFDRFNYLRYQHQLKSAKNSENKDGGDTPVFHQLLAADSTPEARNVLLAQGDMFLILSDELKTFMDSCGRYSKGGNGVGVEISQLLSAWSHMDFAINRKTEETQLVVAPALSIIGGIQPGLVHGTFGLESLMLSGFSQRFLFVFADKPAFTKRRERRKLSEQIRDWWGHAMSELYLSTPATLQLTSAAQGIYDEYADNNDMRASGEDDDYIASVLQKLNIHVLRLAIMSHMLSPRNNETSISEECMDYAIRVCKYFELVHIDRIYPLLGSVRERQHTKEYALQVLGECFDISNKNQLADLLGYDRATLTKHTNIGKKNRKSR